MTAYTFARLLLFAALSHPAWSQSLRLPAGAPGSSSNPAQLAVLNGGPDELPQGPAAFEPLDDGFALADPLNHRIVFYDPSGQFRTAWPLGFAVDRIEPAGAGAFVLHRPATGRYYRADRTSLRLLPADWKPREQSLPANIRWLDSRCAEISPVPGPSSKPRRQRVRFASSLGRPVSVRVLRVGEKGELWVELQAAAPSASGIQVRRFVRRYSPLGYLSAEVELPASPEDQLSADELKIRGTALYQMKVRAGVIEILRWELQLL